MSRIYAPGVGKEGGRSIKSSPDQVMKDLSLFCIGVWESGDGCPKRWNAVVDQFKSEVYPVYQKYRKGDIDDEAFKTKNKKKKKKDASPAVASRKSSRHLNTSSSDDGDQVQEPASSSTVPKQAITPTPVSTRGGTGPSRYAAWLRDHGNKLFNIFSSDVMMTRLEEGKAFDSDFYEDQKNVESRSLVIQTMRVRKEFYDNEKNLELTKARKFARKLSALGINATPSSQAEPENEDDENIPDSPFKTPTEDNIPSVTRQRLAAVTRSTVVRSLQSQIDDVISLPATTNTLVDQSSQTEEISLDDIKDMPLISTRKRTTKKSSKQARLVSPAYLQSGALMMSIATMSSSQAVMAMKIHDETVYRQTRHMPLILNKKYKRKLKLLKKYQALKSNKHSTDVQEDAIQTCELIDVDKLLDEEDEVLSDDDQHDEVVTIETEETQEDQVDIPDDFAPAAKKAKIDELQKSISAKVLLL